VAAERYAEFLAQPLDKIGKPPADGAIQIRLRSGLNRLSKRGTLGIAEARRLAGRFTIEQAVRVMRIEAHHPVPDDLQADPADPCRLAPAAAFINGCQRQRKRLVCFASRLARASRCRSSAV